MINTDSDPARLKSRIKSYYRKERHLENHIWAFFNQLITPKYNLYFLLSHLKMHKAYYNEFACLKVAFWVTLVRAKLYTVHDGKHGRSKIEIRGFWKKNGIFEFKIVNFPWKCFLSYNMDSGRPKVAKWMQLLNANGHFLIQNCLFKLKMPTFLLKIAVF